MLDRISTAVHWGMTLLQMKGNAVRPPIAALAGRDAERRIRGVSRRKGMGVVVGALLVDGGLQDLRRCTMIVAVPLVGVGDYLTKNEGGCRLER